MEDGYPGTLQKRTDPEWCCLESTEAVSGFEVGVTGCKESQREAENEGMATPNQFLVVSLQGNSRKRNEEGRDKLTRPPKQAVS